jgi:hypothetical protein
MPCIFKTVFFLYVLFCSASGYSQKLKLTSAYNNVIKLSSGAFFIRGIEQGKCPTCQIGISYERKLNKISVGIAYTQLEANISEIKYPDYNAVIGNIEFRREYRMVDMFAAYNWHITKNQFISTAAGLSYNLGNNVYLDWYYKNPSPLGDEQALYTIKREGYVGGLIYASYNYLLLKNRINIGADFKVRYYPGRPKEQYDAGIHAGVNF